MRTKVFSRRNFLPFSFLLVLSAWSTDARALTADDIAGVWTGNAVLTACAADCNSSIGLTYASDLSITPTGPNSFDGSFIWGAVGAGTLMMTSVNFSFVYTYATSWGNCAGTVDGNTMTMSCDHYLGDGRFNGTTALRLTHSSRPEPSPTPSPSPFYSIEVTADGSRVIGPVATVALEPSEYPHAGCATPKGPSKKTFTVQCRNSLTGAIESGCTFDADLDIGTNLGGHDHGPNSNRPLGQLDFVDSSGAAFTYEASEISQRVKMSITGKGPNKNPISSLIVNIDIQIAGSDDWVPLSNDYLDVIINSADDITRTSHPNAYYGTAEMRIATELLSTHFVENLLPLVSIPKIKSQAASLPWGGLYDADWNGAVDGRILPWEPPHCGHRDGQTIDLSLGGLTNQQKAALQNAARKSRLVFFYPRESPSNLSANHWHATLR